MEAIWGGTSVVVLLHIICYSAERCRQGINPISHKVSLFVAIAMYWHLFLDQYLYSLNLYDSNKTLKLRCWYIVIAQHKGKKIAYGFIALITLLQGSACVEEQLHCYALCKAYGFGRGGEPRGWGNSTVG